MSIFGGTAGIGAVYYKEWGIHSGSVYVYTKISGKWIENGTIFPDGGAYND